MKYFISYAIAVLLPLFILGSCSDDNTSRTIDPETDLPLNINVITPYSPENLNGNFVSDNKLTHVDILVFEVDGSNEYFSYLADAPAITETDQDNIKKLSSKLQIKGSTQRVVLIANAPTEVSAALSSLPVGTEKEDLLNSLLYDRSIVWTNEGKDFEAIPMWAESDVITVHSFSDLNLKVNLLRMAAKVNVVVGDGAKDSFSIESVHIFNTKLQGRVVPDETALETSKLKVITPTIPDNVPIASTPFYYTSVDSVMPSAYIFESEATSMGKEDDGVYLVIGGKFGSDAQITYYRTDFVKLSDDGSTKEYSPILRNHSYTFYITSVGGSGYPTVDEAKNHMTSDMDVNFYDWEKGEIEVFVYNSLYVLGVSSNNIIINGEADTHDLKVTTDYSGGWTATIKEGGEWLSYSSGNFNSPNSIDTYKYDVKVNDTGLSRYAYIEFRAGPLSIEVKVTQRPLEYITANSYMVSPGGNTIEIPIIHANKDGNTRFDRNSNLTAKFIWTDHPDGMRASAPVSQIEITGEGLDKMLTVTTGSAIGNAVIGVEKDGNFIWSWHIWVTDYDPDNGGTTYKYNNHTFMDRNLGATSDEAGTLSYNGLHYQWGRKDPFIGPADLSNPSSQLRMIYDEAGGSFYWNKMSLSSYGTENIENMIHKPCTFFYSGTAWCADISFVDHLWSDNNGDKTVYDPCPLDWRVPPGTGDGKTNAFTGVLGVVTEKGYSINFPDIGIYQKCGTIQSSTGEFYRVGDSGYYWTSERMIAVNGSPYYLAFTFTDISDIIARTANNANNGSNIRCVKDS